MREILFRAYSELLKEYIVSEFSIFGEWLTFDMFGQFISENWDKYKEHYDSKLLAVNDFIVEQYTGLKDRNGKKIFEGDIVIFFKSKVHRVCWDDKGFWVARNIIQNNYHYNGVALHVIGNGKIEVLGNIHNNLELLEVK